MISGVTLYACGPNVQLGSDGSGGTGGSGAMSSAGGAGYTAGSAGYTAGSAGYTAGSAGYTAGSAGYTAGSAGYTAGTGGSAGYTAGSGGNGGSAGGMPTCTDMVLDGTETDIDCGGPICKSCIIGERCSVNADCNTNFCYPVPNTSYGTCGCSPAALCVNPTCTTNADCGVNRQCVASHCVAVAACSNGVKDGNETDVDCGGGVCAPCATGQTCRTGSDCSTASCYYNPAADSLYGVCQSSCSTCGGSCVDMLKNGDETDVDCGGAVCPPCADNKHCSVGSDCLSAVCITVDVGPNGATLCETPSCSDSVKNGDETDIDCGGSVCPKCGLGKACLTMADCAIGLCSGNVCFAPTP